ncbi:MAG: hypothetical protein ACR2JO_05305 [Mycobacteriales bacterium]
MSLDLARTVADAVLYEGYLLYPYRSTSRKNQVRWQFGILGPPGSAAAGVGEESDMRAECLLEAGPDAVVDIRVRFLQIQPRTVELVDATGETFTAVPELQVDGTSWLSWDEAVEQEVDLPDLALRNLETERVLSIEIPGGETVEPIPDGAGSTAGRLVRRRLPLSGQVRVTAAVVDGSFTRLRVTVDNTTSWADGDRDAAIRRSFVGCHFLFAVRDGAFVSLLEPPDAARAAAEACDNSRCWPVLIGDEGRRDVVLASPIILYDYPAVAPESAGELFDSTEIDEILTLRVMTLTDEEKLAARATDPRAGAIIDRCDSMPPEVLDRLHGTLRYPHSPAAQPWAPEPVDETAAAEPDLPWWDPGVDASVSPSTDAVRIAGVPVSKGSRVRLRPSRRADAQDLFLTGQVATVARVDSDVDGNTHVAVTLVDDPAADVHEWYGRYYYFGPEEIEPLTPEATS